MPSENLDAILGKLRPLQPSLRQEFGVSGPWIFGSYVRGEQRAESDLDVLVGFDRPGTTLLRFVEIEQRLSDVLGRKVDLVQRSSLRERLRVGVLAEAIAV